MTEPVPETLDWVTIRGNCSVEHLFRLLTETVDSDVKVMQKRLEGSGLLLECNKAAFNKLVVAKLNYSTGLATGSNVVFEFTKAGITASKNQKQIFLAKPSFGVAGECKLEIDGQPLELWQVSRRALEDLFFT